MNTESADLLLIKNCRLFDKECDILCSNGYIREMSQGINAKGATIIDASGLYAAPGIVDMHVHLRDPGQTYKEDILTGCAAAAAGGVTSIAAMPNTVPVCDNPEIIEYVKEKSKSTGVHVYPIAAVTKGQNGQELCDFESLKNAGAVAFSDDGKPVENAGLMLEAMKRAHKAGSIVISHCEDSSLAGGIINEGEASKKLNVKGIPNSAEAVQAAREAILSLTSGLPVHIAHVSAAETVEVIREAKKRGAKITAETCPHYICLDESKTLTRDADFRMNPPLRTKKDVEAVIKGLRDGTIDVIATDHAPHTSFEKSDFENAPNGVVGLETSLAVCITYLVKPGILTLKELFEKMSVNPAKILGIKAGTLAIGAKADVVLFDPEEKFLVLPIKLHSKSHNTPFKGMTLYGRVKYTISDGKVIYKA
ncbi:Dihydroorotase [[Clostridium] cellulosi]|uniref:Dihydroorotase n=1 Tax=[Clostridium] cellulosi TaxID=29343 RepID=A0A078KKB3_9FIRM|nr:Dihydroorotase [[Clostridium] cellulosi]